MKKKESKKKQTKKKKKIGGFIIIVSFFGILFLSQMVMITKMFLWEKEVGIDWIVYLFLMSIFFIPTLGLTIAAILRVREIQKGEEEDAKKY